MFLDIRQRELIKNTIKDYKFMKEEIEQRIEKDYTIEEIKEFINKFKDTEITSVDSYTDYGYLDFNYKNANMCVGWESENKYMGTSFEIFDDKKKEYIVEDFLTIEDYEELMNTPKEDMLRSAVADLKFYDAHNLRDKYNKCLEDIIVFLKEEF